MEVHLFSHNQGEEKVPKRILQPLIIDFQKKDFQIIRTGTRQVRNQLVPILSANGWSDQVKVVPHMGIKITSVFGNVGLCLQFGNMARFYADLLKLQVMFENGSLSSAIYILPMKRFSLKLGSNAVYFERLVSELDIYRNIIKIPILVLGLQGG